MCTATISKVLEGYNDELEMQGAALLKKWNRMVLELFMYLCWNSVPDACIVPNTWGISCN